MNKNLALLTLSAFFAGSVFAQNITEETTWTDENVPSLNQVYLEDTLHWQVSESKVNSFFALRTKGDKGHFDMSTGSLNLTYMWLANTDNASNASATLSNDAKITVDRFQMGGIVDSTSNLTLSNTAYFRDTGVETVNLGNATGSSATIDISGSATAIFDKQLNIGSNGAGGKGVVNLSGGNLVLGGITFIAAYQKDGELNVSGGTISSDGKTARASNITVGYTSGKGVMNLTGGATYVNVLSVGNGVNGSSQGGIVSELKVSGASTILDVTSLNVGMSSALTQATGSTASVILSNLSDIKINNASFSDTGRLTINVGVNGKDERPASIQISGNLNYTAPVLDYGFVFDFVDMDKQIEGLANGDVLNVSLMSIDGNFSISGSSFDKANGNISNFLQLNTVLANESGMKFWEDVDFENFVWDNDSNTLSVLMTYAGGTIPEPSTYAMIFGALALAFVAYRKRK